MARQQYILFSFLALLLVIGASGCNETVDPGPNINEPITFIVPDTTVIMAFPGEAIDLHILLATDKIIDTLRGVYHLDSLGMGFDPASTYEFLATGFADSSNIQNYMGMFLVSGNRKSFEVIRLLFTLEAVDRFYQKTLRINVK